MSAQLALNDALVTGKPRYWQPPFRQSAGSLYCALYLFEHKFLAASFVVSCILDREQPGLQSYPFVQVFGSSAPAYLKR